MTKLEIALHFIDLAEKDYRILPASVYQDLDIDYKNETKFDIIANLAFTYAEAFMKQDNTK